MKVDRVFGAGTQRSIRTLIADAPYDNLFQPRASFLA
jgi:hypothetical protein